VGLPDAGCPGWLPDVAGGAAGRRVCPVGLPDAGVSPASAGVGPAVLGCPVGLPDGAGGAAGRLGCRGGRGGGQEDVGGSGNLLGMIKLHFPEGQNYDCVMCGAGCESLWTIPVEPHVVEKIEAHPLGIRVINENGAAFVKDEKGDYAIYYKDPDDPRCGFLKEDKLCAIHAELGMDEKPLTCQQFPFHLTETPDGVFVGVSYMCTAARQNSGRPLSAHEDWLRERMAKGIRVTTIEANKVPVGEGRFTSWDDYAAFEEEFNRRRPEQGLELTAQQALVLTAQVIQENPVQLALAWDRFEMEEMPLGGQVAAMLDGTLFALVKLFLDDTSPERILPLDEAFQKGEELDFPEFRWRGTWFSFLRFQDKAFGDELEDELDRWADMQMHRKSLLIYRPLLDNLWMLAVIPRLVRVYTAFYAHEGGRTKATKDDYYRALRLAEMYLGTNGQLPTRLTPRFNAFLFEIV
jgi:Fe-S-cluster containining protein